MNDLMRFDTTEFEVLSCGANGGYYPKGENAERAKLLMKEGLFKDNPVDKWHISGWQFTAKGQEYYVQFMDAVRQRHKHRWKTRHEASPEFYDDDEYGNRIDEFAYEEGYHNGMVCAVCGYTFCQHCLAEIDVPICTVIDGEVVTPLLSDGMEQSNE